MISIDEQPLPDPSSSYNQKLQQQQQVSHEAFASVSDIDLLKTTTDENLEDTNNLFPNFSIRDYVFESRSKDIARNWPFSDKSLQLCLNYGVKNLLPPFQSLDSVRNYSSVSVCAVENRSPNHETIRSFVGKRNDESPCHLEEDLDHTKSNSQPTIKKFKLVMKLNLGVEPTEETAVSKVCPVCKTFSSSSNTTLNAHIDSCLSEESSMKCTSDLKIKTVKHRVKPRKMRLMVDVYKTAHHCTIEELDRRNGANWATSSSFPDQELEFQAEEKNKEPQKKATYIPEVADHEGAVYIDKNGKKVRILSMPKVGNLDDDEARVSKKGRKGYKVVIKKKNKKAYMKKNDKKILKLSPKSKKLSKKAERGRKESVAIKESCEKEDGGAKPMKAQVNERTDDLAVTRPPWACSKRTGAAKKRFAMHTKRKEGTLMDDDDDDDDDDDGCDHPISSKGSTLSSLKKSLSTPARRERNDGLKLLNLKRKFSALGKSQDSLKQKRRAEEDTSKKMSSEMTNDVEVKTKKSMTSKSSNDDSSSGGLDQIASESARTEDYIGIEPSFTGLKNSMDNQFSKMISQLDNKFDSQQHRTLDDIIMEHNGETQGNYFDEVDPIPIPGPPGSFLPPSPGADIGSEEEQQGNSSLTTMSRVQSSEDHRHHDITNQDFISGSSISTVSSPSFARSADKLSARFDRNSVNNNNNNNTTSDLRSVDASFKDKGPTPCCCSRKEGAFFTNIASYRQESAVPKERATESNGLRSELFPLANHLTLPPPEMVKPPAVTPTTPVLRLMGKNLTVVNTDNEQAKPPCWSPMGQYQQPQTFQNENHDSFFYGHPPQHHITFSHSQNSSINRRFNLYPPNDSKRTELKKLLENETLLRKTAEEEVKNLHNQLVQMKRSEVAGNAEIVKLRKMLEDEVHQREKFEEEISTLQNQLLQISFDADETRKQLESGEHSSDMTGDMGSLISPVRQPQIKYSGEAGEQGKGSVAKLFEQVGLQKILSLLESEDPDVRIHAVKVIANLAAEATNQEKIVEAGGLTSLLGLLTSSDDENIHRVAAGAIANLAMNETNQELIMSLGGISLLAMTAQNADDPQTLRMVAGAIANLCGNDKLQLVLRAEGGIKALLSMVRCRHPDVLAQVARGIANFAKCESRASTQGIKRGKSLLIEDGALTWIVKNANNEASPIRRHIELALCHMAQHEVNAKDMISGGALWELVRISRECSREDIRILARRTLSSSPSFQVELKRLRLNSG